MKFINTILATALLFSPFVQSTSFHQSGEIVHVPWELDELGRESKATTWEILGDDLGVFIMKSFIVEDEPVNVGFEMEYIYENGFMPTCNTDGYKRVKGSRFFQREAIWKFNGQAVKMATICGPKGAGENVLSGMPLTEKGRLFVIELFKKETDPVIVSGDYFELPVSVTNFTRTLNESVPL